MSPEQDEKSALRRGLCSRQSVNSSLVSGCDRRKFASSHQATASRVETAEERFLEQAGCGYSPNNVADKGGSLRVNHGGEDHHATGGSLITADCANETTDASSFLAPFTTDHLVETVRLCSIVPLSTENLADNFSGLRRSRALYKTTAWTQSKLNKPRQLDPDGYRLRASCVCVRGPEEDEILLITSSRDRSRWVIPGGGIEPGESAVLAAERETAEEAGVGGTIDRLLGTFENEESAHRTIVFVLRVERELLDWQEKKMGRDRRWFPLAEARTLLLQSKPAQVSYLDALQLSKPAVPQASVN